MLSISIDCCTPVNDQTLITTLLFFPKRDCNHITLPDWLEQRWLHLLRSQVQRFRIFNFFFHLVTACYLTVVYLYILCFLKQQHFSLSPDWQHCDVCSPYLFFNSRYRLALNKTRAQLSLKWEERIVVLIGWINKYSNSFHYVCFSGCFLHACIAACVWVLFLGCIAWFMDVCISLCGFQLSAPQSLAPGPPMLISAALSPAMRSAAALQGPAMPALSACQSSRQGGHRGKQVRCSSALTLQGITRSSERRQRGMDLQSMFCKTPGVRLDSPLVVPVK